MLVCERALHVHDLSDLFNDVVDGDPCAWLCTLLNIGVTSASNAQPVHIVNVRCVAQMLHRCAHAFVAHTHMIICRRAMRYHGLLTTIDTDQLLLAMLLFIEAQSMLATDEHGRGAIEEFGLVDCCAMTATHMMRSAVDGDMNNRAVSTQVRATAAQPMCRLQWSSESIGYRTIAACLSVVSLCGARSLHSVCALSSHRCVTAALTGVRVSRCGWCVLACALCPRVVQVSSVARTCTGVFRRTVQGRRDAPAYTAPTAQRNRHRSTKCDDSTYSVIHTQFEASVQT
jgi:hypothetical protein